MQMLGVPVTLLDPSANPDALGASVLEGFSIPPALLSISRLSIRVPYVMRSHSAQLPVLSSSLFHPPVL
jgi:hypothetical protein